MKEKKTYEKPIVTKVKFEDKNLVSFGICSKTTVHTVEETPCCNWDPPFDNQTRNSGPNDS